MHQLESQRKRPISNPISVDQNACSHILQTCCGVPSGSFPSVGFYAVPRQWFLEYRGHEGGDCRNTKTIEANLGIEFKCLRNGPYTGAGYGFRSRKRDTGEDMVCAGEGVEKECKGYQRPDVLETADGKKFSLTDLSDDQMLEMFEQEANGTMGYAYQRLEIAE